MKRPEFDNYIKEADFSSLFNQMGWNNSNQVTPTIAQVEDEKFKLNCVAQRNGFKVYTCEINSIPLMTSIKLIDKRLRKSSNDYILIFISTSESMHHEWIVPVKTVDKRVLVPVEYTTTSQLDFLYSKHEELSFDIEEESTILDVTKKVHTAFELNSEKVTKDFYAGFKKQHNQFGNFITGIDVEGDKQWYVSVMLNRLMFCYFIQKKNFLDFNPNYLRDKLTECKNKEGKDKFFKSFYKSFLIQLFQGGLNDPKHDTPEFKATFGRIPYLNGGMFDQHQIEKEYKNIDIADEAFENLFDFFDKYHWHLDTRIEASGKDINPDVLGYIFEQYINDRAQMGAYYTKEDITNYIGKNCILPFLWDKTSETVDISELWNKLKSSDDEYIYDAVKHGLKGENGQLRELPKKIEIGVDTKKENLLERRKDWNTLTDEAFALPTEIWRETVERRNRYIELTAKIKKGEINQINDFITYNLDIIKFTQDVLQNTKDIKLLTAFYHAMQEVTILDPTCGSGAFLFAAMNILEPLYDICLDRMEEFNATDSKLFNSELEEIKNKYRSNRAYFIYKNIILKNLYGVDIMNEAVEIAKLRLFLKMVAVVEADKKLPNLGLDPLPDIDFNIRCGNTLVGYATEEEVNDSFKYDLLGEIHREEVKTRINKVAETYRNFQSYQLNQTENIFEFKNAKHLLQDELKILNDTLNQRMHEGLSSSYEEWLLKTQPFHWFAEFYGIIHGKGGFDVIIGNPPYVEYSKVRKIYTISQISCIDAGNLYAFVIEKSMKFSHEKTRNGMIIQMSAFCTPRMQSFQKVWFDNAHYSALSFFDDRPGKLFDNLEHIRVVICLLEKGLPSSEVHTTRYNKFYTGTRNILFDSLYYYKSNVAKRDFSVLKIDSKLGESIALKLFNQEKDIKNYENEDSNNNYVYYGYGYGYFGKILNFKSHFDGELVKESTGDKYYYIKPTFNKNVFVGLINSTLFYWFYINYSDGHNFTKTVIGDMPFDYSKCMVIDQLINNVDSLMIDLKKNKNLKIANYKSTGRVEYDEYHPAKSKYYIDKIDTVLAKHYGFSEEELDYIINYDIKYRMGDGLNGDEE